MTEFEFDQMVNDTCDSIKKTLVQKGKEYRRNKNVFHNFEEAARKKQVSREFALDFMALKHEISIDDMTKDLDKGILPTEAMIEEKFGDAINYLIIKKAMFLDQINPKRK